MSERPAFPPLFRPFAVTSDLDPFERAVGSAAEGAEAGTLLWSVAPEVCQCAVVLAPEQPLEPSLPIALITALGIGDALGALVPPVVAVTYGWPDRIEVNGGLVGGIRLASAGVEQPDDIPDWLAVGFAVVMRGQGTEGEPGHDPRRTTLAEEGCGEVQTVDLLEAFGRHFLSWINRWQEDGVDPVRQAWLARATGLGTRVELEVGGRRFAGTFSGLTESGAMRLVKNGVAQTVSLEEALKAPSWSL